MAGSLSTMKAGLYLPDSQPAMRLIVLLLLSLTLPPVLSAQDLDNYVPLQSTGTLPEEFLTLSSEKYAADIEELSRDDKSKDNIERGYYLEANFLLDELLLSGKVLLGDPLTAYVNQVASKILPHIAREAAEHLKFYVVKYGVINAYAADRGAIMINMGLLAKLESEAQLAFVLCHEITHYLEQHNITRYVTFEEVDAKQGKRSDPEKALLSKAMYSREQESEADIKGYELYLKAGYDPREAVNALKQLETWMVPCTRKFEFDAGAFGLPDSIWPQTYFPDSLTELEPEEDDELSSHPGIQERITTLSEMTSGSGVRNNLPESEFERMRSIAQRELVYICLLQRQYDQALFIALNIREENPSSIFAQRAIARSLYGLSKHATHSSVKSTLTDKDYRHPDLQPICHFFTKLEDDHLAVMALNYCWQLHKAAPDDKEMAAVCYDLMKEFKEEHDESGEYSKGTILDKSAIKKDTVRLTLTRYMVSTMESLLGDSAFAEAYKGKKGVIHKSTATRKTRYKVILVDPIYVKLDERSDPPIEYLAGEEAQVDIIRKLQKHGEKLGLDLAVLTPFDYTANSIDLYNQVGLMKDAITDLLENEWPMVPVYYDATQEAMGDLGSTYLGVIGSVAVTHKKEFSAMYIAFGLLQPQYLMAVLGAMIMPNVDFACFYAVYDMSTSEQVGTDVHTSTLPDSRSVVNSILYYQLMMLKKSLKRK